MFDTARSEAGAVEIVAAHIAILIITENAGPMRVANVARAVFCGTPGTITAADIPQRAIASTKGSIRRDLR